MSWQRPYGALWLATWLSFTHGGAAAERLNLPAHLKALGFERIALRQTGENHFFLTGEVNGRRRSCLVDTGWSVSAIATNAAEGLNPSPAVATLKLSRVVFTYLPVVVQDLQVNGRPAPYDVVLGCDFLFRHHALLDCANRRLYVRTQPLSGPEADQLNQHLFQLGHMEIVLQKREPPALTCKVRIQSRAVELLVDSGAMWSCLDTQTAGRLQLRTTPSPRRISGPAAPGPRPLAVAEVTSFHIGERNLGVTGVAVLDLSDWGLGENGGVFREIGGVLGNSELTRANAVIDCGQGRIWVRQR